MKIVKLTDEFTLDMLPKDFSAVVLRLKNKNSFKRHLAELSLCEGSKIIARDGRKGKTIRSYEIASSIIAIRNSDAKNIIITNIDREGRA